MRFNCTNSIIGFFFFHVLQGSAKTLQSTTVLLVCKSHRAELVKLNRTNSISGFFGSHTARFGQSLVANNCVVGL